MAIKNYTEIKDLISEYKKTYERLKDGDFGNYKAKLKELKTWTQVKSPKQMQGFLSYALDWLSPELLGTGFRIREISDHELKGSIPYKSGNLDFQMEIHQGLVLNAILELVRTSVQSQIPDATFRIIKSEVKINKSQPWDQDLILDLKMDSSSFDDFFIDLQENKTAGLNLTIHIVKHKSKKIDEASVNLQIEPTWLLKKDTSDED